MKYISAQDYFTLSEEREAVRGYEAEQDYMINPETRRLIPHMCAEALLKLFNIVTSEETDEIYIYQKGVYVPNGVKIIKKVLQQTKQIKSLLNTHAIKECIEHIRRETYQSMSVFDKDKNLICLENGVWDIEKGVMRRHEPKYKMTIKLPVTCEEGAQFPKFKKFLGEILPKDIHPIIQEMFGYCLYKSSSMDKVFMFYGSGANGKSILLNVLVHLLGKDNVSRVPLQTLEYNRFSIAKLIGKMANIFPDISNQTLKTVTAFKTLSDMSYIEAEIKHVQGSINFVNYAKMIFSANQLPHSWDDTDAYFRRWQPIKFPYTFGTKERPKRDKNELMDELTGQEEISGIFNWAIEGLSRLLKNGRFSETRDKDEIRREMLINSSPIILFLEENLEYNAQSHVTKNDMHEAHVQWGEDEGLNTLDKSSLGKKIQRHMNVTDGKISKIIEGEKRRIRVWKGISFKKSSPYCMKKDGTSRNFGVITEKIDSVQAKTKKGQKKISEKRKLKTSKGSLPYVKGVKDITIYKKLQENIDIYGKNNPDRLDKGVMYPVQDLIGKILKKKPLTTADLLKKLRQNKKINSDPEFIGGHISSMSRSGIIIKRPDDKWEILK